MKFINDWNIEIKKLDSFTAARARIILAISIIILTALTIVMPIRVALSHVKFENLLHIISAYFMILTSLVLIVRNPRNRISGYLITFAILTIIFFTAILFGGLKTPGLALLMILPLLSSFLMDKNTNVSLFLLSLVLMTSIYILSSRNLIPSGTSPYSSREDLIRLVVYTGIICISFGVGLILEKIPRQIITELREIYDSHPSGIIKIDNEGHILYANQSFKNLFGNNILIAFKDIAPFLQEADIDLNKVWNSKINFQLETKNKKTLLINFKNISSNNEEGLIFFSDITLSIQNTEFEKIIAEQNARDMMVSTYNHEINNPLMVALAYTKKMERNLADPEVVLPKISQALIRIDNVVKEIDKIYHSKH